MTREEILQWLREDDSSALEDLWRLADAVRSRCVGDEVHLRGLVEFSNRCARKCTYCGLRVDNTHLRRYRMSAEEIVGCARKAVDLGYGTLVLQSGEDPALDPEWLAGVVSEVKAVTPLAVTLSVGEWPREALRLWKQAGADRYLLRFETSDESLFQQVHPPRPDQSLSRFQVLDYLRELDYEVGSGVLIGLPGQTYGDLARSMELLGELELEMIGCGPFIPHPDTPLAAGGTRPVPDQVPGTELMTYKVLALARITCPYTNVPATTALATLDGVAGYETGLRRGANVIMPNLTPLEYRRLYQVYPGKAEVRREDEYHGSIRRRIEAIGRRVGVGPGGSIRHAGGCAFHA